MGFIFKRVDFVGGSQEFPTGNTDALRRSRSETILLKCVNAIIAANCGWSLENRNYANNDPTDTLVFADVPCMSSANTYPGLFLSNSDSGCKMFISYFGGGISSDAIKDFKGGDSTYSRKDLFAFGTTFEAGLCISVLPAESTHDFGSTFDNTFLPDEATRIIGTALYWEGGDSGASYASNPTANRFYSYGIWVTPYTIAISTNCKDNYYPNINTPAYACGKIMGILAHAEEDTAVNAEYGLINFREGGSATDLEGTRSLKKYTSSLWHNSFYVPLSVMNASENIWAPTSASVAAADGSWRNGNFNSYNNCVAYVADIAQISPLVHTSGADTRWVPICVAAISTTLNTYGIIPGDGYKGYVDTDLFRCAVASFGQKYDNSNFICADNDLNLIIGWDPDNTDTIEAPNEYKAYFNADESVYFPPTNAWLDLYSGGIKIPYDSNKTYTPLGFYDANDNLMSYSLSNIRDWGGYGGTGSTLALSLHYQPQSSIKYLKYSIS